ncbi:unnamed protein product [Acanthoscelides obtectus]|uniref:Uncharacterized protein n=1 Tax=Acanthoscelides obtectus TaxID=200917 RepID=A0A9P0Q6K7_ACAOB|nr:unnamed protein product [Acanthoscelides obtectus]CAK1638559.1 hypothetical protein AOBTE_LOCUS10665 [Acanthoscelides obtectus]
MLTIKIIPLLCLLQLCYHFRPVSSKIFGFSNVINTRCRIDRFRRSEDSSEEEGEMTEPTHTDLGRLSVEPISLISVRRKPARFSRNSYIQDIGSTEIANKVRRAIVSKPKPTTKDFLTKVPRKISRMRRQEFKPNVGFTKMEIKTNKTKDNPYRSEGSIVSMPRKSGRYRRDTYLKVESYIDGNEITETNKEQATAANPELGRPVTYLCNRSFSETEIKSIERVGKNIYPTRMETAYKFLVDIPHKPGKYGRDSYLRLQTGIQENAASIETKKAQNTTAIPEQELAYSLIHVPRKLSRFRRTSPTRVQRSLEKDDARMETKQEQIDTVRPGVHSHIPQKVLIYVPRKASRFKRGLHLRPHQTHDCSSSDKAMRQKRSVAIGPQDVLEELLLSVPRKRGRFRRGLYQRPYQRCDCSSSDFTSENTSLATRQEMSVTTIPSNMIEELLLSVPRKRGRFRRGLYLRPYREHDCLRSDLNSHGRVKRDIIGEAGIAVKQRRAIPVRPHSHGRLKGYLMNVVNKRGRYRRGLYFKPSMKTWLPINRL